MATSAKFVDQRGNVLPSYRHLQAAMLLDKLSISYSVVERGGKTLFLTERGEIDVDAIAPQLSEEQPAMKTIEISDASLNFDYAHFLPSSPKCSVLHGHSSRIVVELSGFVSDDMVVEFGEAKSLVKRVLGELDHKLIVARRYVEANGDYIRVSFIGKGGRYVLELPSSSVYIIEGESTVENISEHIARRIAVEVSRNVRRVVVKMFEGFGKSALSSV
ncbi:MAG: 6-carboxytetrahydropterin synthase [Aigarchaeota archaeon]|nr:6-carboxytetrahydropterin synthase [Candidatus Pelearchaeum maunauluense]